MCESTAMSQLQAADGVDYAFWLCVATCTFGGTYPSMQALFGVQILLGRLPYMAVRI